MRSSGTDIESERGLFRLHASKKAIDAFYGRVMAVISPSEPCDLVFSPASAARESAHHQNLYVKFLDFSTQPKTSILAVMDHDDILAITVNKTTNAYPNSTYVLYVETKLAVCIGGFLYSTNEYNLYKVESNGSQWTEFILVSLLWLLAQSH